jgi:DNA-binding CsgD family transcriptional regulator
MYKLGNKFKHIHFSRREAECMVHLLRGRSIRGTAKKLGISHRTVEFYVKNMKKKLNCKTKYELIAIIVDTDFLQNIDF